ncbi:5-(carboxyamino)imidazole ribonucleotide synthase [Nodosilinea sp. P-1105]|uniref:5-(carboxyamino)imidazole ribonucleotide synthase n=1 Tax=Nodosilinea sp. P-1105 TaxID=2546229 RepID=UPI00146BBDED|nr:5-(carboxyamino)imidazole ribonucleotide synthase [Nodosilinea sp. P-1105]NMF85468.1 5-(carboxyamino)imidazole ribonucleotide synthase [Nodosilinea sp. P-1105]
MGQARDDNTPPTVQRVGVIGGGQLAWMMGPGAKSLGLELVIQTPDPEDPAVAIAQHTILAPITDVDATAVLASQCDVITFENEFIDCAGLQPLVKQGTMFRPGLELMALVLDKLHQRQFFQQMGLPNPRYVFLDGGEAPEVLLAKAETVGFPLVMKTRRLGYDGYGTFVVADRSQLTAAWQTSGRAPVLLEEFVPFKQELAIVVARSVSGELALYPAVETQQVNQICRRVVAPAPVSPAVMDRMATLARTLVNGLDLVGVMAIECFLTEDDQVLINEIAPRTHNSGHYSLDACVTSQFEQQLRAISDRPLGPTDLTCDQAVMVNLLGLDASDATHQERLANLKAIPQAQVYWYGKSPRPGRKLGHVTQCLRADADSARVAATIERLWYGAET